MLINHTERLWPLYIIGQHANSYMTLLLHILFLCFVSYSAGSTFRFFLSVIRCIKSFACNNYRGQLY